MPAPENPKVGGCYIWFISFLLFIFTISGAVFLLLYVTQPPSKTTSVFAIIGVSLVFLPWLFWCLTFFYRVVSRNCGFRMVCFGPYGSGYPNDDDNNNNIIIINRGGNNINDNGDKNNGPVMSSVVVVNDIDDVPVVHDDMVNGEGDDNGDGNVDLGNGETEPTGPRRVRFGGVVIIGDEDANLQENDGSPEALSRSSSSSSSSMSRHSHDSETPLRLSMA